MKAENCPIFGDYPSATYRRSVHHSEHLSKKTQGPFIVAHWKLNSIWRLPCRFVGVLPQARAVFLWPVFQQGGGSRRQCCVLECIALSRAAELRCNFTGCGFVGQFCLRVADRFITAFGI